MNRRVNVTIPDDVADLFDWMVKYDPQFKGKEASVVSHFFTKGILAAYQDGLKTADPLDSDEFSQVADHARETFKKAAG